RHSATENPDAWYEAAAGDEGNNYSPDLQRPHVLHEIVFGCQQQRVAAKFVAFGKLPHTKKVISSVLATDVSLVAVTAVPSLDYGTGHPAADFADRGELRAGGICSHVFDKPRKLGMRYEDTKRVKDYRCSMLSGPLRVDQIAEVVELEVGR